MAKLTVARDTPLSEITLRRYEKPYDLSKRELVKKLCLSIGLLNPGDSRDVVADVLLVLLEARKAKTALSSDEIATRVIEKRKQQRLRLIGIANSNVRRQILRMRRLFLVEKIGKKYRIAENGLLTDAFAEKVEHFILPSIVARVNDYLHAVDQEFS